MSPEFWLAIVAQTIIIVAAVIGAYVRQDRRLTKMEGKVDHLETIENERGVNLHELERTVAGISRAVARLEGAHSTCPWIAGQKPPPEG